MNKTLPKGIMRNFLSITHCFFIIIAAFALICAISAAIYGLINLNASVDTTINKPNPSYEELKKQKNLRKEQVDKALKSAAEPAPEIQETTPQNPDNIPLEFMEQMTRVEISLKTFARNANQMEPSNNTRAKIYKRSENFNPIMTAKDVLDRLEREAKYLESDAPRIRTLPRNASDYITWAEFLTFFFDSIQNDIMQQQMAINAQKIRAAEKRVQAMLALTVAGWSFGAFLVFTMYLAVLSIEKNSFLILKNLFEQDVETA